MSKQGFIQKLGRYHLHAEIARGGMATVYRGELVGAAGFRREVAVKRILPQWTHEPEFVRMLIDEAKVLVGLHHHNIVQVFELGEEQGNFYIVMEYVRGLDLKRVLNQYRQKKQNLPIVAVLQIARQICEALICAHEFRDVSGALSPIVHRDVSPQNILIRHDGLVKLTDFGIAKMLGKSTTTRAGTLKGKFSYMSPEQAIGTEVDPRTDVFAFGLVLYEMLIGKKCFEGNNDFEILEKIKSHEIQIPEMLDSDLSLILKNCLQKNLHHRYANLRDTLHDLNQCLANRGLQAAQLDVADVMLPLCEDAGVNSKSDEMSADTQMITVNPGNLQKTVCQTEILVKTLFDLECHPTRVEDLTQLDVLRHVEVLDLQSTQVQTEEKYTVMLSWAGLCGALSLVMVLLVVLSTPMQDVVANFMMNVREPRENVGTHMQFDRDVFHANRTSKVATPFGLEQTRFKFKLKPQDAAIQLSANGTQKHIKADQVYRMTLASLNMPLVATIEKEGFKTLTKTVNLHPGQSVHEFQFVLEELGYGAVSVQARPWGVAKIIDETESKTAPALFDRLPEGTKTVSVFYPPLKKSVSRTIQIADGTTVNCRASFGINKQFLNCW